MKSTLFLAAASLLVTAANAQTDSATQSTNSSTTTNSNTTQSATSSMGTTSTMSTTDTTRKLNSYGSYSTRDSIAAKYKLQPMPGALTVEKTFPILGTYQLNTDAATGTTTGTTGTTNTATSTSGTTSSTDQATDANSGSMATAPAVTITLDSASKGIVWVDGLQQGRLKAYLKKSPATYRIVAQKASAGSKAIPEGVMHLDPATNTLHIALGIPYNEVDPTAVFALSNGTASEDNTAEIKVKTKDSNTKSKVKSKVTFITATKVDATQQMQGDQTQQGTSATTTQQGNQQQ